MRNYNEKFDLIETKRGQKVFLGYKFIMSKHSSTYISYAHVKEALSKCKTLFNDNDTTIVTIDLGRTVGKSYCVPVTDENSNRVQMLYRKGKIGRTPIIINGPGKETSLVTIVVVRDEKDRDLYRVCAAYYGMKGTKEPWDKNIKSEEERHECIDFWSSHALCMSSKVIDWDKSNFLTTKDIMYITELQNYRKKESQEYENKRTKRNN